MDKLIPAPGDFIGYVYGMRAFIYVVLALFLLSAALGYVVPTADPQVAGTLLSGLKEKSQSIMGQPQPLIVLGIFFNNAIGALMAFLFGLLAGLFPLFFVASNGMVLGIIFELSVAKLGAAGGIAVFAAGILPHGVLELPAVLLSAAAGLKLGYSALRSLLKGDRDAYAELKNGLLVFVFWIAPILFLAAIIETFVTGAILAYFVHAPLLN